MMEPNNILLRIATFSANLDICDNPLQLARHGLFYDGRYTFFCVHCGLEVPAYGERPLDYHSQRSPGCSTNGNTNNNAVTILRSTVLRLQPHQMYLNVRIRQPGLSFELLNVDVRPSHPTSVFGSRQRP